MRFRLVKISFFFKLSLKITNNIILLIIFIYIIPAITNIKIKNRYFNFNIIFNNKFKIYNSYMFRDNFLIILYS